MTKNDLRHKKVAVLGIGIEGLSLLEFLSDSFAMVTVVDERLEKDIDPEIFESLGKMDIPGIFGPDALTKLSGFEIIFRSPGIKRRQKSLDELADKGVLITSPTQLFFDLCPCPIIGVTGTKGKGTTSSLITEMLIGEGFKTYLGGNIGTPPLTFLDLLTPESKVVLEMSSFQLQDLTVSPHIAVMLMTTSEHLDYHKDVYEYIDAKRNILRHQTTNDFAILNKDYPANNESDVETVGKVYKVSREQNIDLGCYVHEDKIFLKMSEIEDAIEIIDTKDILLPGKHNLENVCAAILAAALEGAQMTSIIHVLKTFKGLEHRLELVKTVHGVRYYDDSFSTTPETAIAAIEAFSEPEILMLGGSTKNSDFKLLGETITEAKNIKAIITIGIEWEKIKESIKGSLPGVKIIDGGNTMDEMVQKAAEIAVDGDVVLMSPACASFDKFKNYKERGQKFKDEVNKL